MLKGDVPSPANAAVRAAASTPAAGCASDSATPSAASTEEPLLRDIRPGQQAACHFGEEITPQTIEVVSRTADHVATAEPAAS